MRINHSILASPTAAIIIGILIGYTFGAAFTEPDLKSPNRRLHAKGDRTEEANSEVARLRALSSFAKQFAINERAREWADYSNTLSSLHIPKAKQEMLHDLTVDIFAASVIVEDSIKHLLELRSTYQTQLLDLTDSHLYQEVYLNYEKRRHSKLEMSSFLTYLDSRGITHPKNGKLESIRELIQEFSLYTGDLWHGPVDQDIPAPLVGDILIADKLSEISNHISMNLPRAEERGHSIGIAADEIAHLNAYYSDALKAFSKGAETLRSQSADYSDDTALELSR